MRYDETAIVKNTIGSNASEKTWMIQDVKEHQPSDQAEDHRGVYCALLTLFKSRE